MAKFEKFSMSTLDDIAGFDLQTGKCLFILDEITDGTIEGAADITWSER